MGLQGRYSLMLKCLLKETTVSTKIDLNLFYIKLRVKKGPKVSIYEKIGTTCTFIL